MSANRDQNRNPVPADPPAYFDEVAGDVIAPPQYERFETRPPRYTLPLDGTPRANITAQSPEGPLDRIQRMTGQFIQRVRQRVPRDDRQPHDDHHELERRIDALQDFFRNEPADNEEGPPPAFENPAAVRRRAAAAARRREREDILRRIEEIKRDAALQKEMDELLEKVTDVFRKFKDYWKPRDRDDEGSAGGAGTGAASDSSVLAAAYFGY